MDIIDKQYCDDDTNEEDIRKKMLKKSTKHK